MIDRDNSYSEKSWIGIYVDENIKVYLNDEGESIYDFVDDENEVAQRYSSDDVTSDSDMDISFPEWSDVGWEIVYEGLDELVTGMKPGMYNVRGDINRRVNVTDVATEYGYDSYEDSTYANPNYDDADVEILDEFNFKDLKVTPILEESTRVVPTGNSYAVVSYDDNNVADIVDVFKAVSLIDAEENLIYLGYDPEKFIVARIPDDEYEEYMSQLDIN